MNRKLSALALVCCVFFSIVGCGESNQVYVTKVAVTVTYKGKPVEGATVVFNNQTKPAFGITNAEGKTNMTTYSSGDGAIIALHGVSISKMKLDPKLVVGPAIDQMDPNYDPMEKPSVAPPKSQLPQKYLLPTTSGLTADVVKGGENVFEWELTD